MKNLDVKKSHQEYFDIQYYQMTNLIQIDVNYHHIYIDILNLLQYDDNDKYKQVLLFYMFVLVYQ
jgi:hypothetical protein